MQSYISSLSALSLSLSLSLSVYMLPLSRAISFSLLFSFSSHAKSKVQNISAELSREVSADLSTKKYNAEQVEDNYREDDHTSQDDLSCFPQRGNGAIAVLWPEAPLDNAISHSDEKVVTHNSATGQGPARDNSRGDASAQIIGRVTFG